MAARRSRPRRHWRHRSRLSRDRLCSEDCSWHEPCSMTGRGEATDSLHSSLLPEPQLQVPSGSAGLALEAQRLLHPMGFALSHSEVSLRSLPAVLQFTDLLDHLLAEAPRASRADLHARPLLLRSSPDRAGRWRVADDDHASDGSAGATLPALP